LAAVAAIFRPAWGQTSQPPSPPSPSTTPAPIPGGAPTPEQADPGASGRPPILIDVPAVAQTEPVDSPDDSAIWVHPTDPEQSLIVATDKKKGLLVYDMQGKVIQRLDEGRLNNVDLRYGMVFPQGQFDVLAASHRDEKSVRFYTIDPQSRLVRPANVRPVIVDLEEPYGLAMFRNPRNGQYYVFVGDKSGNIRVLQLYATRAPGSTPTVDGVLVASPRFNSQAEGMVVDDERGVVYVAEESAGIWRMEADPELMSDPVLIDRVGAGRLKADVEGLAIYHGENGSGYLIASSQGDSTFAVYDRRGDNPYIFSFRITQRPGAEGFEPIDAVEETDGIDVTSMAMGARFPGGLLVVQDGVRPDGQRQNFKLVSWWDVVDRSGLPLVIENRVNPRDIGR
jgi:3-phytase